MTYLLDLLTHLAHGLAIAMVQHAPGVPYREWIVESEQSGAADDEVIRVTYRRERKAPTLEFKMADYGGVLELPLPEMYKSGK